jgi:hypothetical protein
LHVVWQAAPLHLKPLQLCVPAAQLPPAHVPASVSDVAPAAQLAIEQAVPSAYFWQPPAPSHLPFVPQDAARLSAHMAFGSIVPAARGAHVPALPETLQAWHEPQAALPQQTPSTQWPVRHWLPAVHAPPAAPIGAHVPPGPVQ